MEDKNTLEQGQEIDSWKHDVVTYLEQQAKAFMSASDRKEMILVATRLRGQVLPQFKEIIELLPDGQRLFNEVLAVSASNINTQWLLAKRSNSQFDFEEAEESARRRIVEDVVQQSENSLRSSEFGLSVVELSETIKDKLSGIDNDYLRLLRGFDDFTVFLLKAGAINKNWFVGLETIKLKLFYSGEKASKEANEPNDNAMLILKEQVMNSTDEMFLALEKFPTSDARNRATKIIEGFDIYLLGKGISRRRPKLGNPFDYNWQYATSVKDGAVNKDKISSVYTNAFFDTSTNKCLRESQVEVE